MPVNNPEIVYFSNFFTSVGHVYIAKSTNGVCHISFPNTTENKFQPPFLKDKFVELERNDLLQSFLKDISPYSKHTGASVKLQRNNSLLKYEIGILKAYFKGKQVVFDFPLDLRHGTPFQKKVWGKLLEIPYGECRSYKWIAEQIGYPRAARAVGMANNKNPLPPVIPCHRVIGSNGELIGYASGLHIKKQLLEMEYNTISEK